MFTIQYRDARGGSGMQEVRSQSRTFLLANVARFEHPIMAVYEQATVITKAVRNDLRNYPGELSSHARDFLSSPR